MWKGEVGKRVSEQVVKNLKRESDVSFLLVMMMTAAVNGSNE